MGAWFSSVGELIEETFSPRPRALRLPTDEKLSRNMFDLVAPLTGAATGAVTAMASIDSGHVACGYDSGDVAIWSPATGQFVRLMRARAPVTHLAVSRDRSQLAAADTEGGVTLWQAETGRQHAYAAPLVRGYPLRVLTAAGKAFPFATANPLASSVTLWSWAGVVAASLPLPSLTDDQGASVYVESVMHMGDVDLLVVGTSAGDIVTYVPSDGHESGYVMYQQLPRAHRAPVERMLLLSQRRIATASCDGTIHVWVASGDRGVALANVATFEFPKRVPTTPSFAKASAAANAEPLPPQSASERLKGEASEDTWTMRVHEMDALGERYLAARIGVGFAVVDLATKRVVLKQLHRVPSPCTGLAGVFAGRQLITGHTSGSLRVWRVPGDRSEALLEIPMHEGAVSRLHAASEFCFLSHGTDGVLLRWSSSEVDASVAALWASLQPDALPGKKA